MKLLVDMNLSPHWVDRLNAAGLPAVHWSRVGPMDAADIEISGLAVAENTLPRSVVFGSIFTRARSFETTSLGEAGFADIWTRALGIN